MPGDKLVKGNQKGKLKGARAPNPLLAVMAQVPKASAKGNTKGASHTHSGNTKGASHTHSESMKGASHTHSEGMKGASHTQATEGKKATNSSLLSLRGSNLGASNTSVPNLMKGFKGDGGLLRVGEDPVLEEKEEDKAQKVKEQMAATLTHLARELSDIRGGPLLSDTLDANHMACYQALDAERISLMEKTSKEECSFTAVEMWLQAVEMVRQSGAVNRDYTALVDEEWQYRQYAVLFRKRSEKALSDEAEPGSLIGTHPDAVKRLLTGAAQRLQEKKNLDKRVESTSLAEKVVENERKGAIQEEVRRQSEKECYDAMNQEIEVKSLFSSKTRGVFKRDTRPTKEELLLQSKWVVEEMGPDRSFQAVTDRSWIWQMYCLLSKERRLMTMYPEYETFMLGSVKRLEKMVQEQAQAERIARIVEVSVAKQVATSPGQKNILIAEVIEVEADNSSVLGEEDFTPLKFFSRRDDNELGDEVDYDSDSQKGASVGSPCSLQLAFSSPLSLDKDLSACMALLRNSPSKKDIDSPPKLTGAEESKESGGKEQEGTSHAQDQASADGGESFVSVSSVSLLSFTGNEGNEAHPPIRKVRGLTPPTQDWEEQDLPLMDAEADRLFDLELGVLHKTRKQLRNEVQGLENTITALKQHVQNQAKVMETDKKERDRLRIRCERFAGLLRLLPDGLVDEALIEKSYFSDESYARAMYEHCSEEVRLERAAQARRKKLDAESELDETESSAEEDTNKTPSPVKDDVEHSTRENVESSVEEAVEVDQGMHPQDPQLLQEQNQDAKGRMLGPQLPSLEDEESPASANPAKRNLSGSDDSDAGSGKPDTQRMKVEHGTAVRTKAARSNRWGAKHNLSGIDNTQYASTAVALGMAMELTADRRHATSRREVSNNLRGTHDPVLGFGGKVTSQESIQKDIFRSADSLRLPKGQESLVFHRGNFMDQNAVVRSANAYVDFIIEDACALGIPEEQRIIIRGRDGRNGAGIPDNEVKRSVTGQYVVNAAYIHMVRQSDEDLKEIHDELEAVMVNLQRDPTRMTQFRGWSSRNAERSREARERCFHWSAPGTPQLPRLPYTDKLHKLSGKLEKFLQIGGRLHDDCVSRKHIPPGFAYQLWLDKVKSYREGRAHLVKANASQATFQLLRRVPHTTPSTVSSTVSVKKESAVTGGKSMVMLIGTPEGKMSDLRKQKDAVMYLSGEYDEDDMTYYAALFKRTMEADISATVGVQEKEEARQVWLASKHDSINDQLRQLKNNKQQKGHGPVSGQGGV